MIVAPLAGCATVPGASTRRKPNFLLLLPDQFRFDWLSGNPDIPVKTPNLDRIAARGVRFDRAWCASPICAPSRAALMLGREYDECGVGSNQGNMSREVENFVLKLRQSGYRAGSVGKLDLAKGERRIGIDGLNHMAEWGFSDGRNCGGKGDAVAAWRANGKQPTEPYMAYLAQRGLAEIHADDIDKRGGRTTTRAFEYSQTYATPLDDADYCDNWLGRTGLEVLRAMPAEPWFMQVNFVGPHDPMDVTKSMLASVAGRRFDQPVRNTQLAPEVHQQIRRNYTAMVENIDRWVGEYLSEIERRGEIDNTYIILSSDHGELLGDHDLWAKNFPYEPSVGVPLIFGGPEIANQRSNALVEMIDIGATILDLAGAERPAGMTAQSFRPLLEGRTKRHRTHVNSGFQNWRAVRDERYKLVRGFDPEGATDEGVLYRAQGERVLLFDLANDPDELTDLSKSHPEVVTRLKRLLPINNTDPAFRGSPRARPD